LELVVSFINDLNNIDFKEISLLQLTSGQVKRFIFAVEGVGVIFLGVFLTVYLLGLRDLPGYTVYHSEPIFRTLLSIFGSLLIAFALIAIVLSIIVKKKN